ncbi:Rhs-family protein [hydrothermal vent metagenome]|uniref:Rhs-family protein n=1 Tax=hydrothermal vent metagenome TaxID=652676 RepID=A0A3B0ZCW0_9ZZZZ
MLTNSRILILGVPVLYHYHLDHLGTPRELTDAQGKIVWRVKYKTYGNVALKEVEGIENNLRFQGQYFDEETGLHYNRHRYYNPDTGQFINQDPIGLFGGINNYQYVDNPTGWIDPFGLTCKEGKAIIRQYNNGHPEGHFTVEIVTNDLEYSTHQVITAKDQSQTTIVRTGRCSKGKTPVHEAVVDLPDAQAALDYQKNMINEELGMGTK